MPVRQCKWSVLLDLVYRNEMVLLSVNDTVGAVEPGPMESKGNLVFMFTDAEINLPIVMQNLEDPITKVIRTRCCDVKISLEGCRETCQN